VTTDKADAFDLQRFVDAQAGVFDTALGELQRGRKQSHWMWFIFPQLRGLGRSPMAHRYGIASLAEANAYLQHPILGPRLELVTQTVADLTGLSLLQIFGPPDDMKFCSSMTLFARATSDKASVFRTALERYCGGQGDRRTLDLLGGTI
jgi:uncharacterized protein (DUF1810 family)